MTQLSVRVRNARLQAIPDTIGASALLELRTGARPADCAQPDTGTELVQITLPASYYNTPAAGVMTKAGTWQGTAVGSGNAGHFRVKDNGDTQCDEQGSVTGTGGGGHMEVDNVSIEPGQTITVLTFTHTDGNA